MKSYLHGRPSFLKQTLLIAAPLAVLSGIALYSLRQDKASLETEARDRARMLAPELARQWGQSMSQKLADQPAQRLPQGLVADGKIVYPLDYPPLPTPPDWPEQLTPEQMRLWRTAEESLLQRHDPLASGSALAALKSAALPEAALANAEFSALLRESEKGGARNVAQRFTDLARRYPTVSTEAGTPLADLALFQALRHTPAGSLPDRLRAELTRRVAHYPSFLVPELLEAADRVQPGEILFLTHFWRAEEESRRLLHFFLQPPIKPARSGEAWIEDAGQRHLTLWGPGLSTMNHVIFVPSRWLEDAFLSAFNAGRDQIPSYAGVIVEFGNARWIPPRFGIPEPDRNEPSVDVLASASGKLEAHSKMALPLAVFKDRLQELAPQALQGIQGQINYNDFNAILPVPLISSHPFTIRLTLAHPDLLYARYQQRLWLAVGLILSAVAAAGIGLVSAWRAFQRQLRLAEMTSNFVSSVSHELRSPLASVRLMAESLDQGRITESEKQKGYFRLIVQECRRLSALVENVLDFSRIHQGRKRYEFEPIDLAALVRQTVALMVPLAEERQVSLILEDSQPGSADLQPCWDGQAMQQALVNLVDNAIKHAPAGTEVKIGIAVVNPETEPIIRITVEDAGQGIPVEEQERIFEPFYRLGSELRRETRGIGIGLSIVKHIAEAHGGRVLVHSTSGQGSRFTLELPQKFL
jgi:signal transduction histidine kinase